MNRLFPLLSAIGRRTLAGLLLLVGASGVIYLTVRMAPGNAVDAITSMATTEQQRLELMAEYGLDRDPFTGYVAWLGRAALGDFGESLSFHAGKEVMELALPANQAAWQAQKPPHPQ